RLESGEIAVTSSWARVSFASPYVHPIVIAGPPSATDISPCTVQIRNVTSEGFDIRLAQWPYQDGVHGQEFVSYLVLEQGRTVLADGSVIEAGSFTGSSKLKWIPFAPPFASTPVVLTSVVSVNESAAVAGRLLPLGKWGFIYFLQKQESNASTKHGGETVHYVAWEPGSGVAGTLHYEAFTTGLSVDHLWTDIALRSTFEQPPILLARMQTMAELDTANLRLREVHASGFQTRIQEEQSLDDELEHKLEKVGYLALSQASTMRLATFSWEFDKEEESAIGGFRLLVNGQALCTTNDVTARSLTCKLAGSSQPQTFTLEAMSLNNEASDPSNSIVYQP
ncbi:MAG: hypothetical protein AB7E77_06095, partial [Desulfobulbus sp.]